MTEAPVRLAAALADRYRIERELGQGGMATVYLAHDVRHDRKVAIKVLRPELAAVIGAERFLREITTTANLRHPHILPLYDSGEAGSFLYYVMPFVEGESLRGRLDREKQLPVNDALQIVGEVADALSYAHSRGVIHRDIKPDNILLESGHAVVADFGIAKAIDDAGGRRLTATGLAIGTPRYMSPEQSVGETTPDGRSDVYSLGCVLFEMLAGETPYTGPTAQAIIAKRMTLPVPSVRMLRETVPESVDQALTRALAKSPADRFATAHEFSEVLGGRSGTPARRASARSVPAARWITGGAVLLALVVAAVGIFRSRHEAALPLDPNLLVVTPFDVFDPTLEVWSEGVVDFLSRTLDGAGSLRTVAPSVVLSKWKGRSDLASATAVSHRAGAGLAATGSLSRRGLDSVEIRGALLDIGGGGVIGEVAVSGPVARVGELVDSLGLEFLRALSRVRPVAAVRQAAIGAAPLPALKAFLRGEQFYRRAWYDSALAAYSEAIEQDSTFAMAYYRMATMLGWNPPNAGAYDSPPAYAVQAFRRNHGLSERDSLFIAAESAYFYSDAAHPELSNLAWARLNQLVRRFPQDPEAWYRLGEARMHDAPGLGQDKPKALEAFDRAIELDSSFAPAWEHPLEVALTYGGVEQARRYALALAGAGIPATTDGAMVAVLGGRLLLDSTGLRDESLVSAIASAGPTTLFRIATEYFTQIPDSAETQVALFRRLDALKVRAGESYPWVVDSLMRHQYVALALANRGHLHEAIAVNRRLFAEPGASRWSWFFDPFLPLALLGAIPADEADRAFAPSLEPGASVNIQVTRSLLGLPWWAMRRDTSAIHLFGKRMREAGARQGTPEEEALASYLEVAAEAYLALGRGDSATALRHFDAMPACPWEHEPDHCNYHRYVEATVLAARREDLHAAAILDTFTMGGGVVAVLARVERAEIAEQLKDRKTAQRHYQFVVDAWRRADPELAPYVARAKAGLARVAGEPQ